MKYILIGLLLVVILVVTAFTWLFSPSSGASTEVAFENRSGMDINSIEILVGSARLTSRQGAFLKIKIDPTFESEYRFDVVIKFKDGKILGKKGSVCIILQN